MPSKVVFIVTDTDRVTVGTFDTIEEVYDKLDYASGDYVLRPVNGRNNVWTYSHKDDVDSIVYHVTQTSVSVPNV